MFVLADMEWMTNNDGHHSPTQLAAIKVDEQWNPVDTFESFIRPRDTKFHDWKHIAYTGGTAAEFLHAKNAHNVLTAFEEWLNEEDILLWWYDESSALFKKIVGIILKEDEKHKAITINGYVYEYLNGQPYSRGNAYRIAEGQGISTTPELKHNSFNDVGVMQKLMNKIAFPQEDLLKPLVKTERPMKPNARFSHLPLQYDPITNTIHKRECELLASGEIETQGYENWKTPLRKRYRPCECCRKEYTTALRERNLDILERTQYTYVYTPNSKVFHKCSCGKMLSAKNILGARKYDTVIKTGRTPCKLCNPSPSDIYKLLPPEVKIARLQKKIKKSANVTDKRAIARQKLAVEERYRLLNDENLTQTEKDDIYTLTQPRFAFWVGKGYQTFHLRSCSKLNEISNLRGFGTYKEAIHAGYTPCRQCKPTSKHDVKVSIPFTNRVRLDENLLDIKTMCEDAGYLFNQETEYIYIETPVGKWKIKTSKVPVKLEHINLATNPGCKTYHDQPRIFLSFIDTFDYIKRHDEKLLREKEEGKVYVKFISKD